MFDTLDDTMKQNDQASSSAASRLMPWIVGILATVVVLGGLYIAMNSLG
jgi:cobalamin biosynthesis Mg chelatase CobN